MGRRVGAAVAAFAIALALTALGVPPGRSRAAATVFTPVTFGFTGASQTYTVPSDGSVCGLDIVAVGANGGGGNQSTTGLGGEASAIFEVAPGATVSVTVGGVGADPSGATGGAAGFGGGGAGGDGAAGGLGGGGGGGATTVRINGALALVAAGGGGTAANGQAGGEGGAVINAGSSRDGAHGAPAPTLGGGGATSTTGGAAGTAPGGTAGGAGTSSTGGDGGDAAAGGAPNGGGGGGGGFFGGGGGGVEGSGGGGGAGGGGGGSSFVASSAFLVKFVSTEGNPAGVKITPECFASVVLTATVIGSPPPGPAFGLRVECPSLPGLATNVTFDARGTPTSNNVVRTLETCTITVTSAPGSFTPFIFSPPVLPPIVSLSCVPGSICSETREFAGFHTLIRRVFNINAVGRSGPIGTVNMTFAYPVPAAPNFTG